MQSFDAIVVGGGPAGSSCAAQLKRGGLHVAVLDRASFPRVKLCAGWLSSPVWDLLQRSPTSYPGGLWQWKQCHVHYGGRRNSIAATGYFIRRYEFDSWLLSQSGATVIKHAAKNFSYRDQKWRVDGKYCAPYLIGAAGTACPVARAVFPKKRHRPVGAQELEFEALPAQIEATRTGKDGEPELLLHDDLGGYAWNIPKTNWLNVGCGTMNAKSVRSAWGQAKEFFVEEGHLPVSANQELTHAKGHSYYLFDPANLESCYTKGAFLIGDSLGLAQPLTAEGILPAVLSGRLCAEAILEGKAPTYRQRLERHAILRDYDLLYRLRERIAASRDAQGSTSSSALVGRVKRAAIAHGFAYLFSGRPLPLRAVHPLLRKL